MRLLPQPIERVAGVALGARRNLREVRDFLDRVFDGQPLPLVQQLISDRGLSDEEIDELQRTLNQLKQRKP